jgi:hypothetical protein
MKFICFLEDRMKVKNACLRRKSRHSTCFYFSYKRLTWTANRLRYYIFIAYISNSCWLLRILNLLINCLLDIYFNKPKSKVENISDMKKIWFFSWYFLGQFNLSILFYFGINAHTHTHTHTGLLTLCIVFVHL